MSLSQTGELRYLKKGRRLNALTLFACGVTERGKAPICPVILRFNRRIQVKQVSNIINLDTRVTARV